MADTRSNIGRTDVTTPGSVDRTTNPDRNPDAITGAPGSHPVGTGVGAAAAGAAGAAIGSIVPGIGTAIGGAVGAVIGAVAGGLAGKGVAEAVNPTEEDAYWRNEYRNRPYYQSGSDYDQYEPAYRHGYTAASSNVYQGRDWDDVESDLSSSWERDRGRSSMDWADAKNATRDAWDRATSRIRGSSTSGDDASRGNRPSV